MHDSLPTGDLTELLGAPSAACDVTTAKTRPMPLDPDHALQPLSSGLESEAPYHLVVVGGQEVPVGYGGWSGPNWTETIQRWLSGGGDPDQRSAVPSTPTEQEAKPSSETAKGQAATAPFSPNSLHQQHLEAQTSETLALPEDALDLQETHGEPSATSSSGNSAMEELRAELPRGTAAWPVASSISEGQPHIRPSSAVMGRNDSSDTTNTDRSVATDKSALAGSRLEGQEQDPEAPVAASEEPMLPPSGVQSPYILVTKERLMGIYCSLWIHSSCAHLVQGSSTGTVTAGLLAGKLGNKGAACISLKIVDTRFLFVCAHLAAHSEKSALRQANVRKIKEELVIDTFLNEQERSDKGRLRRGFSLSKPATEKGYAGKSRSERAQAEVPPGQDSVPGADITELFDHTFWFGDCECTNYNLISLARFCAQYPSLFTVNFRLDISRLHADFLIQEQKFDTALTFDQLGPILYVHPRA